MLTQFLELVHHLTLSFVMGMSKNP